jgi:hypothetical protein
LAEVEKQVEGGTMRWYIKTTWRSTHNDFYTHTHTTTMSNGNVNANGSNGHASDEIAPTMRNYEEDRQAKSQDTQVTAMGSSRTY